MYRVIDGNDTGKTRKLLTECGTKGIFVCAHPERVFDKCRAYNIPAVKAVGYDDFIYLLVEGQLYNKDDDRPIYIDELEKFVKCCVPYLAGYTLTNE